MSLWSLQRGRRRPARLAGAALAVALCLVLFGCGRTPPEGFWEPTSDDSARIKATIEANKGYFKTGLAELAMVLCDTALPGTTATILRKELQGNPFKQRFRLDSLEHVFYTDSFEMEYTFIAGLNLDSFMRVSPSGKETTWVPPNSETTCTITFAETIPGMLRMHAWGMTDSLRESLIIVPPAETLRLPFYADTMTHRDTVIEKAIAGASTDGCVLRKVNGEWVLWKMAGGGRFYAPGPEDAPYIVNFYLKSKDRVDTVNLRPDTLHYGIQRFFSVDTADHQLLTFSAGDSVKVTNLLTNLGDAYDYLYFNGRRYEFKDTVKFDSVSPGIYRLSLEHIPAPVLWEVKGKYTATVWGVPIRVAGGEQ
jgi:hypothetical protein